MAGDGGGPGLEFWLGAIFERLHCILGPAHPFVLIRAGQ